MNRAERRAAKRMARKHKTDANAFDRLEESVTRFFHNMMEFRPEKLRDMLNDSTLKTSVLLAYPLEMPELPEHSWKTITKRLREFTLCFGVRSGFVAHLREIGDLEFADTIESTPEHHLPIFVGVQGQAKVMFLGVQPLTRGGEA